jgi:hypothetical protein
MFVKSHLQHNNFKGIHQNCGRTKNYRLHLPPNIPAKDFWSIVLYDNQTRSLLQTDHQFPSISSQQKGVAINPDQSVDVYFGPIDASGKKVTAMAGDIANPSVSGESIDRRDARARSPAE